MLGVVGAEVGGVDVPQVCGGARVGLLGVVQRQKEPSGGASACRHLRLREARHRRQSRQRRRAAVARLQQQALQDLLQL
eukprot:7507908-Pyramimonas_sp.AAC.1